MRTLFIFLVFLVFVGCTYSNSNMASHYPALSYSDSQAPVDQNLQQYLTDLNRQENSVPLVNNGGINYSTFTFFDW